MKKLISIMPERQCGDCKACCEGWLYGEIDGKEMFKGKPCHFISDTGCSVYEHRPVNPCVNYKCMWLVDNNIPGWLKPNKCHVILTKKQIEGVIYIEAIEAGSKIDSTILNWLLMQHVNTNENIYYTIDGIPYWIGSKQFCELAEKHFK